MNKDRQVLGVIGGLGPIATAHFMEFPLYPRPHRLHT